MFESFLQITEIKQVRKVLKSLLLSKKYVLAIKQIFVLTGRGLGTEILIV